MSTILKRMDTESIIRHFILAAMILLIVGLIFLVICWPQNHSKTFSQHAAAHNTSTVYYILLFTAVIPLLSVFFFGWFIQNLQLHGIFVVLIAISLVGQYLCTLVPEKGRGILAHRTLAGISAVALLPALGMIAVNPTIGAVRNMAAYAGLAVMAAVTVLTFFKRTRSHAYALQSIYFLGFFIPIVIVVYSI